VEGTQLVRVRLVSLVWLALGFAALILGAPRAGATTSHDSPKLLVAIFHVVQRPRSPIEQHDLWLASPDGELLRRLTHTPQRDEFPGNIAPNGRTVVFTSIDLRRSEWFETQALELFRVRVDGSHRVRLTANRHADSGPAFAPDGRWIAWVRTVRDVGGTSVEVLMVMRRDGDDRRPVWRTSGRIGGPSWSPDGRRLAFGARVGGDVNDDYEAYSIRPDGTRLHRLTRNAKDDFVSDWSPDGRRLLGLRAGRFPLDNSTTPPAALLLIRLDGSGSRTVLNQPRGSRSILGPGSFHPDGRTIRYGRWANKRDQVEEVALDGSGRRILLENALL
jgi:dipeptidyl aminopeptidase/acylaminoacyl peptidase